MSKNPLKLDVKPNSSENVNMQKNWNRSRVDSLMKGNGGAVLGGLGSVMFAGGRSWPAVLGAGIGLGLAYVNCQRDLNQALKPDCPDSCDGKDKTKQ